MKLRKLCLKRLRRSAPAGVLMAILSVAAGAQVFPDRLADWDRIDSVSHREPEIPVLSGIPPALAAEYGVRSVGVAHYRKGAEQVAITMYCMISTAAGFGLFSALLPEEYFTGQMGNGIYSADSMYRINYGSICAFLVNPSAAAPYTPPVELRNAFHDLLIAQSDLSVLRVPLPYEERKFGSERFLVGARSWASFRDPHFALLFPLLASRNGYIADYVKERLPIRRRMILIPGAEKGEALMADARRLLAGAMRPRGTSRGIEEYEDAAGRLFLLRRDGGVYFVHAAPDDPGAFEWLAEAFPP